MTSDITGVILAGGQSRRFGRDKAAERIDGRPMALHVYDALAPLCDTVVLSGGTASCTISLPDSVRILPDRVSGVGPLAGIDAGFAATVTPWVFVVACDLPHLTADALRALSARRTEHTDAVVATTPEGRHQPLCACYHRRTHSVLREQIAHGHYAVHRWLDRLDAVMVPFSADALRNVNTPADLARSD